MPRPVFLSLGCALLLGASGCTYFQHLRKDAAETLHVSLGASWVPGLYARVQVPVVGTSLGYLPAATYVGTDYGYTFTWRQAGAGILLGGQIVRTHLDADIDKYWNGYLADAYVDQSHYLALNVVATDKRTKLGNQELIPYSKIEGGVHLLFVGAQAGVDFIEALDLVAGVFGWDMLGDDDYDAETPEADDAAEVPAAPADPKKDKKKRKQKREQDAAEQGTPDGPEAP
jgi:hypothetical protein